MQPGPLLLLPLLLGCVAAPSPAPPVDLPGLAVRGAEFGGLVRAAHLCALPLSQPAQERAAVIEAATIEMHQREGGTAQRDAFLHSLAPPHFDARKRGVDRAAWCGEKQVGVAQMDTLLNGAEGTALVQRAEAAQAGPR